MVMPQCCYLAKGAKRPSQTSNTIKFDRIPFDPCNSIKRFDLCPFDQKNSTYLQPPIDRGCGLQIRKEPVKKKVHEEMTFLDFFSLSDVMDLRHQSSAMCIIMFGGEDTHPWSATKVGDPISATIPVDR